MNKILKLLTNSLLIILFIEILNNSFLLKEIITNSVSLWLNNIFPSLFPILVLNDLIINTNLLQMITKRLNIIINKLLNLNGNSFEIILLSFLSGTPTSAYIIKENLNKNKIDIKSANKLIKYTYFSNPLFLYYNLINYFQNNIVIRIILVHYFANIIIAFIYKKEKVELLSNEDNLKLKTFFEYIPSSINKSMSIMIMILGTLSFFMIVSSIIINKLQLSSASATLIKGLFEITQGITSLNIINNKIKKEIITLIIISFGGLSIHTQIYAIIKDSNIKYKNFLIGRLLQVLISLITYFIIIKH